MPLWLGTSWKMTKTLAQARSWSSELRNSLHSFDLEGIQAFVLPSHTATAVVHSILGSETPVIVGVQNAHWEDEGAWTGEVSVMQAKDAGASIVEIGHSERREYFGETIETTRLKVYAALRHGLTPLLCVGEGWHIKQDGGSAGFILGQAHGALEGLTDDELSRVLIAYEPIWAIGAHGRPATAGELREPLGALAESFGDRIAGVLYGGSVDCDNAPAFLATDHVDGLFVGRAAWQLDGFLQLLRIAEQFVADRA